MDDDYVFPTFYEQHLAAHSHGDFSVSVTQRWISNEYNIPIGRLTDAGFITGNRQHFTPLAVNAIAQATLPQCINWLGELSNMVFKTDGECIFPQPPTCPEKIGFYGLLDIGSCLHAAQRKPAVYISSFHSCFRQHANQTSHRHAEFGSRMVRLCWAMFGISAHNNQMINNNQLAENLNSVSRMLSHEFVHDNYLSQPLAFFKGPTDLTYIKKSFTDWYFEFIQTGPCVADFIKSLNNNAA